MVAGTTSSGSSPPVFLGDELSAAGFRLAGALIRTPEPEEVVSAFEWARQQAPLVLITAALAEHIPSAQLAAALAGLSPLVLIVPDINGQSAPEDLAAAVHRAFGMESEA